ncbi:FlgO family outer membrane protein [uncultured Polaribacter sp.]|uniref:FlgO family outer membrane protein n=1 Tax=uncultured Polaribacter sp. TaxID=174711 RepID=UPI00260C005A|nr:FlgO family outer membrane protein [uncultured Polaribacter sp.]
MILKKNYLLVCISIFSFFGSYSQDYTDFDKSMISLAEEVAKRIKSKNKLKVAIWDFTDSYKRVNALGNYIREDFSIHFTNASEGLEVINRENLNMIFKEHQLNEEGFINPATAKQLGMLDAADAIIIGTIDKGLHNLRLRIKIINTESGLHFAAALRNLPIDENIKVILEQTGTLQPKKKIIETKRVNSNEKYNDASLTNKKCELLKTGDYCFKNTTNSTYLIDLRGVNNRVKKSINIGKIQDACFYDLPEGNYEYSMYKNGIRALLQDIKGSFRIEKCKSLTYKI